MSQDQVIARAVESVKLARKYAGSVEFSAEDSGRTDVHYLAQLSRRLLTPGATTVNLPRHNGIYDSVGIWGNVPRMLCVWSRNIHCERLFQHIARTIWGSRSPIHWRRLPRPNLPKTGENARLTGLGERAGNTSLEEVVMALKTRKALFGVGNSIRTKRRSPRPAVLSLL